jgi:transposase-like protein/IS1 family transposase
LNCHCCSGPTKRFGHFENKNRIVQRFRCVRCGKTFSEVQPLDELRIDDDKAIQIVKLLAEGVGVRASGRLVGCHIHTVLAVLETFGEKCAALLDHRIRNIAAEAIQIDELWARVGIRQSRIAAGETERGDFYTFLALDARTKLIISHHTGKRDYENTDAFVADLASRVKGRVQITSDGWKAYPDTIRHYLLQRLDYAVLQKNYAAPASEVEASRRYSPAPFIGITLKVKAGSPRRDRISTSFVERQNLSVRTFNRRFTRLCLGWSRKLANHRHSVAIFVATHNYVKRHSTLGTTPAVGAGLASAVWTVEDLFRAVGEYQVTTLCE